MEVNAQPVFVNRYGKQWQDGVDNGAKFVGQTEEKNYNIVLYVARFALGVFLAGLSCGHLLNRFKCIGDLVDKRTYTDIGKTDTLVATLYVSMGGNPVHKGHMDMIAAAVNRVVQEGYFVDEVKVAFSDERYIRNKIGRANKKIEEDNKNPDNKPKLHRVLLERAERITCLRAAIAEAKIENKFKSDLKIDYYNDQKGRDNVDHPEGYKDLAGQGGTVFFVAGTDLCNSMGNWVNDIAHAVIVTRDGKKPAGVIEEACVPVINGALDPVYTRWIVENGKDSESYSSTAIQEEGKYEMLPESYRERFKQLHLAAQPLSAEPELVDVV